jgi:hypothetical protein
MIRMENPSFCFNSCDVGYPHYRMWRTVVGPVAITPSQLVGEIVTANLAALNVGTIWIVSCDAASSEKGQSYCQTLANVAGTQVIASDSPQEVTNWQGAQLVMAWTGDNIDDFEGTVYSFTPARGMLKGIDPEKDVWTVQEPR